MNDPKFTVYPSLIIVEDGDQKTNVDVGWLYAMLAAHIQQNGLWNDIDFNSLSGDVRDRFTFDTPSWQQPGAIVGLRFTRKRYG